VTEEFKSWKEREKKERKRGKEKRKGKRLGNF
jgi:hypothetical protein